MLERLERLAVDSERHLVVLPGEVVVALANEAPVDAVLAEARLARSRGLHAELLRLTRGEGGLEDQPVEGPVPVLVHRLAEDLVAVPGVGDPEPSQLSGRGDRRQVGGFHLDHLHRASDVEGVRGPKTQAGLTAARRRRGHCDETRYGDHSHRSLSLGSHREPMMLRPYLVGPMTARG